MKLTLFGLATILFAIPPLPAQERSLNGFLEHADSIFVGRVVQQRSYWDEEHRLIWTDNIFQVQQWLKGGNDSVAVVKEAGGTVGDLTLTLSHPVDYRADSTYLVFAISGTALRTLDGDVGRLSVLESGDGSAFVRIYPDHPLSGLADHVGHSLQNLTVLADRLRQRIED